MNPLVASVLEAVITTNKLFGDEPEDLNSPAVEAAILAVYAAGRVDAMRALRVHIRLRESCHDDIEQVRLLAEQSRARFAWAEGAKPGDYPVGGGEYVGEVSRG